MNPLGNRRHFSSVDSIGQDKHVSFRCSCIIIATPAGRIQLHYSAEIVPIRCSLHSRYPLVRVGSIFRRVSREKLLRVGARRFERDWREVRRERIIPCSLLVRILRSWLRSRCVFFGETWRRLWLCFQLGGKWVIREENDRVICESFFLSFEKVIYKLFYSTLFERNF